MLVDKLHMLVALEQYREIIEPGDHPLQFYPVHQKHGDGRMGFADVVKEKLLKVPALIVGKFFVLLGTE